MKSFLPFLRLLFFTLLIHGFAACKNSGKTTKAYTLAMRMKSGDKFTQASDVKTLVEMETMGEKLNMRIQERAEFEVIAGDTNNRLLKITYTQLLLHTDKALPGQDAGDTSANQINDRIKGKSVILKLGNGNEITEVSGLDDIFADSPSTQSDEDVKRFFEKEELNNTFGMMLSMYPEKPVKEGESWNKTTTLGISGFNLRVNRTYTLQSVKNNIAVITFEGVFVNDDLKKPDSLPLSITMQGSHSGDIQVNMENGYMIKAHFKVDAKGVQTNEINDEKHRSF